MVKDYYWRLDSHHNVIDPTKDKQISMHKLIMGDGIYVHKNGMNNDNRKENIIPARGYYNGGKTILNGYIAIYMPEHIRAFDNGCVYEHIIVAEKMIGRKLLPEEVVHHKDKNRKNNSEDNLMVFATESDHIAYHGGGTIVLQENGAYKTISKYVVAYEYVNQCKDEENKESINVVKIRLKKTLCPVCNKNLKEPRAKKCLECHNKDKAKNIPPKEELERLIYNIPFTKIGELYGVSDKAVSNWCKKYNLPYRKKDMKTN